MKIGEKVIATITKADYSSSGKQYMDNRNCPMAQMAKRIFGVKSAGASKNRIVIPAQAGTGRKEFRAEPGFGIGDFKALENGIEKEVTLERIS
jgi:hypothetical protein